MGICKGIIGWVIFIIAAILLIPITIVACGLAPRDVRRGWDKKANEISGLDNEEGVPNA